MASEGSDYTILYTSFSLFSGKPPRPKFYPVYPSFFIASAAPKSGAGICPCRTILSTCLSVNDQGHEVTKRKGRREWVYVVQYSALLSELIQQTRWPLIGSQLLFEDKGQRNESEIGHIWRDHTPSFSVKRSIKRRDSIRQHAALYCVSRCHITGFVSVPTITRSSAVAERPRDASRHWIFR